MVAFEVGNPAAVEVEPDTGVDGEAVAGDGVVDKIKVGGNCRHIVGILKTR
jgi:hypothetical protein